VELACLRSRQSRHRECDQLLQQVEKTVHLEDWETHWSLHLAYEFGASTLGRVERKRRAFEHLLLAAEWSDDARLKLSVADHYRDGLNHVAIDWNEAGRWYEIAASTGNVEGVAAHKAFQRKRRRARVPQRDGA
jgi:hypothetical protein